MDEYLNKKYKLVKSENYDKFMIALDIGYVMRKIAGNLFPIVELRREGDLYTIVAKVAFQTVKQSFKFGEAFEEIKHNGKKVTNVLTIEGNKLIQVQKFDDKVIKYVKEFTATAVIDVITMNDFVCTRTYKLVEKR